ncbi:peptidylprolyl isomerase [Bailinhaonella thermotolerans]|uniref:Peptidylprolyl isomerase n=1 Tax=Bailinhaonella thermotolerans TaxID=1070861 RepID=A0A3A4BGV9_9ACTN|nr:peptidylprolyl isomerase [Bailinhaonella thermotolerans]RJL33982.1 peptidylprolyl isomerase [Bailinhaonella thermotolerans]
MSGKDRQKKLAREHYERQKERRLERERRQKRNTVIGSFVAVAVVVGGVVAATVALRDDGKPSAQATASGRPTPEAQPTTSAPAAPVDPTKVTCDYIADKNGEVKDVGKPPAKPDLSPKTMTLKTTQGDVVIELATEKAPCTVNSMAFLAKKDYFDDTKCHRLVNQPGQLEVLQCGDPLAKGDGSDKDGTGGPGYRYAEENLQGATYGKGTVAMAKTQMPSTTGSQFFIVYADSQLPPEYTPFGKVVKGLDIVEKVGKAGIAPGKENNPATPPKVPVGIKDVTISGKS